MLDFKGSEAFPQGALFFTDGWRGGGGGGRGQGKSLKGKVWNRRYLASHSALYYVHHS